ncbi:response regulator transcription factor [Streptomyces virginiae]|uniref:response regulator transcription factor n=1 Tax=Streptomyces virginiae TaxID=1961 RepID=UPI002B1D1C35|nr:LuxR C-terminal-related transcriptional regulator [Streptomyces virginiae]
MTSCRGLSRRGPWPGGRRDGLRSLFVEETTVKTHINNAFAKIDARNRADAVRYAFQQGLVQL